MAQSPPVVFHRLPGDCLIHALAGRPVQPCKLRSVVDQNDRQIPQKWHRVLEEKQPGQNFFQTPSEEGPFLERATDDSMHLRRQQQFFQTLAILPPGESLFVEADK